LNYPIGATNFQVAELRFLPARVPAFGKRATRWVKMDNFEKENVMKEMNAALSCFPRRFRSWVAAWILLGLGGLSTLADDAPVSTNAIDPHAQEYLRRSSDYLAQAQFFSVSGEIWQDAVLPSGERVQADRMISLDVRRPNRLHAEVRSTRRNRGIWYDGKTISTLNRNQDLYGVVSAPDTLDSMVDYATTRFGIAIPLEDLVVSNPYEAATKNVTAGRDIGPTIVLGVPCEHLAFTQTNIDWQVWIEEGPRPVPRKIVITYKDEEGSPQYTALLTSWDFETKLPDFVFKFEPPPGAAKINVVGLGPQNHNQRSEKEP
jgi:hypothetical protein